MPRKIRRSVVPAVLGLLAQAGCGGGGASPTDAAVIDPDGDSPDATETGPTVSHCPTTLTGPSLVKIRWDEGIAFCIDSTEVTNADYATFLAAAVSPATGRQAPVPAAGRRRGDELEQHQRQ